MAISAAQVKVLRDKTSAGMMECKRALTESEGDLDKAVTLLRERGLAAAAKKADRATDEGIIGQYIHAGGKLGVLVEVNCETDFVARTSEFQDLVKDLAMQIAAADPKWVRREEVPQDLVEKELEIYRNRAKQEGKPDKMLDRIAEGRLSKFYAENCFYEQAFVKNPDQTIDDYIKSKIATIKENITVRRFARFKVGE